MSISRIRGWRFWAVTVVAVAISVPVMAQSPNSLAGMLGQIITMLQSVQQSVDGLTREEGNVLATPALFVGPEDRVRCDATNVSAEPHTVRFELFRVSTGALANTATVSINPNESRGLPLAPEISASCRITVTDGVKSDVRGAITMIAFGGRSGKLIVAAE